MIKIEFPADRTDIAVAIGKALRELGGYTAATAEVAEIAEAPAPTTFAPEAIVGPIAEAQVEAQTPTTAAAEVTAEPGDLDGNGVMFNSEFCSSSKKTYGSGPRAGRWQKRRGVDDTAYDAWYAEQLGGAPAATASTGQTEEQVDTSAAFGAQQQAAVAPSFPTDNGGSFMGWVAEMQVAGHLTQQDIDGAYQTANVTVQDLFGPLAADAMQAVGGILAQKVPA